MEKRGLVKRGVIGTLFLACLILIFTITFSGALIVKDKYVLGDRVKLDLSGFGEYKLKIITPSTSYFTQGNSSSFSFKPVEVGKYILQINSAAGNQEYYFEVINQTNTSAVSQLSNPVNYTPITETASENNSSSPPSDSMKANFTINREAVWHDVYDIPENQKNVKIKFAHNISEVRIYSIDNGKTELSGKVEGENLLLYGLRTLFSNSERNNYVTLTGISGKVELEYNVSGPKSTEEFISDTNKRITVYSDDGLNYTNVLSYTNIPEKIKMSEKDKIKLFWNEEDKYLDFDAFDKNNNGYIDYVEWIVPHLSNQTFEIIIAATNAEHLDANKDLISNVYDSVKASDNNWSEAIPEGDFVRVTFERNLTNKNFIDFVARSNVPAYFEVYVAGTDQKVGQSEIVSGFTQYVSLEGLTEGQDAFDLKIKGAPIEFDYIHDAPPNYIGVTSFTSGGTGTTRTPDFSSLSPQSNDTVFCQLGFRWTNVNVDTITPPAGEGWSLVFNQAQGTNVRTAVYWKRWGNGSTDDSSPTFTVTTGGPWGAACSIFRNANTTANPWDNVANASAGASQVGTAPAANSNGDDRTVLRFFATSDDNALGNNDEGVLAYGGAAYNETSGNGFSIALSYLENRDGAGSVGTATMNQTVNGNDVWMFGTVVLTPAPTAGDTTYPIFSNYWDNNGTLVGSGTALFNVTVLNTNGTVRLQINNINYTATNITANVYNVSVTTLLNGTYSYLWLSWGNGSSHNLNSSVTRSYTINGTTQPIVNIVYPANTSYNTNVSQLNYTYSNAVYCWYSRDNGVTNSTPSASCSNFTNVLSVEGSNTWILYANNSAGNLSKTNVTFFKDTIAPGISIIYPQNTTYTINVSTFNYTCTNGTFAWYSRNLGVTNSSPQACGANFTNVLSVEGSNTWILFANDSLGNLNRTNVTFSKNPIYPIFSNYWDNNGTLVGSGTALFNVTVLNTNGTVRLQINNINYTATNITANVYNVSVTTLLNGTYSYLWLSWGNGSDYNFNNSITMSYTVNASVVFTNRTFSYLYTYSGVTTASGPHKAYNVDLDAWPPYDGLGTVVFGGNTNSFTELTNAQYVNISASDDTREQVPNPGFGDEPMLWLIMKINESVLEISNITFLFEGYPGTAGTVSIYLFNNTDDAWMTTPLASASFVTSDATLTGNLTSGISDFINASGHIRWGIYSSVSADVLNVDFVAMNVSGRYNSVNITVISPTNKTYNSTASYFNVSTSVNASWCGFSLDGTANTTMIKFNNTYFYYTNSSMTQGQHYVNFICNDTNGEMSIVSNRTYFIIDTIAPTIAIVYPQNITYNTNVSQLNYTRSDLTLAYCWYSRDNGVTNSTPSASCSNFTNVLSIEGSNTWILFVNDSVGNTNKTNVTFFKDSIKPLINYGTGTEGNNSNLTRTNIVVNVTATDTNLVNVTLYLYNSTGLVKNVTTTTSPNYYNFTNLPDGQYWFNATAYDLVNNVNYTTTYKVAIDTTPPTIAIVYPQNITYNTNVSQLNYTRSDLTLAYCWYSRDNGVTNSTPSASCSNFTNVLSIEGSNTWALYVNDSVGNLNSTNVTFFKDTLIPQVQYGTGTEGNNSNLTRTNIVVNVTATDTNLVNITLYLYNTTGLVKNVTTTTSPNYYNFTNLPDGTYWFNATAYDSPLNVNRTTTYKVIVDTIAPNILINTPSNGSTYNDSFIYFNATVTDSNLRQCWYTLDNGQTNVSGCQADTISVPDGDVNLTVYADDYMNHSNFSTVSFFVNSSAFTSLNGIIPVDNKASVDIALTTLNNQTFAISWITNGTVYLELYNTTGKRITLPIVVNSSVNANSRVALTSINSSTFIVGWFNNVNNNVSYKLYNLAGINVSGNYVIDYTGGIGSMVALVNTQDSFQYCFVDDAANTFVVRSIPYSTLGFGTLSTLDTNIGSTSGNGNTMAQPIACFPGNLTTFVAAYFDNSANNERFLIVNKSGSIIISTPVLDASVTNYGRITTSSINQQRFMVAWEDFTGTDSGSLEFSILLLNGTVIANDNFVEANVGTVGVTANSRLKAATAYSTLAGGDAFILAWNDQNKSAIRAQVMNENGTVLYGPYNLATDENTTSLLFDVYGKDPVSGVGLCRDVYVMAYTNITGGVVAKTFNLDGSSWNGVCVTGDFVAPTVNLISPDDNSSINNSFSLNFIYNVSDESLVDNCSIIVDGVISQTASSITKDSNQSFNQYMTNGVHNWSVSCTDHYNNVGVSQNRTVNVSISQPAFSGRFYETYTSNYPANTIAKIWLNNTRDAVQNSVYFQISPSTLEIITKAYSPFMENNGAIIPSGSVITFSSSFSAANSNIRITWKLLISNSTGTTLLCQNGNDGSGGTQLSTATITGTNSTCINRNIRLLPSDSILLQIDAYDTSTGTQAITHVWDGATSSFVDVNITTEGFLSVNMTSPTTDQDIVTGQQIVVYCNVSCSIGYCRNTQAYVQYNTSSSTWMNLNGTSGNLILSGGETNPHNLGNLTGTARTNFTIQGNLNSTNNIRCIANSSYATNVSGSVQVNVTQSNTPPIVNLTSPLNGTWFNYSTISLFYNDTDVNNNIANSSLILNGQVNMTNQTAILNGQINNFTLTLPNGFYSWTVNSTDTTNLQGNASPVRYFYVDTTKPAINLSAPYPNQSFYTSSIGFNYTVTDNLDTNLICNITIDGVVRDTNIPSQNGTLINRTISGMSIGLHWWNVSCIDHAANLNISLTRNFTVSDLPPNITLVTSNASTFNTSTITLLYNATDNDGLLRSYLILNGLINMTNQSAIQNGNISNFTLTLSDGFYNWTVIGTDTSNLNGTAPVKYFTVDSQPPSINLNLPANNTAYNSSTVVFNFTVIDNVPSTLTCNLSVGERQDLNFQVQNGSLTNRTLSNFTDGARYWNVTCTDATGNRNVSESRLINITVYPLLTLQTKNNTYFNVTSFNLTYLPSDNTNLSQCNLYINGVFNMTNQTAVTNGLNNSFSLTDFADGKYNWSVACFDYLGLTNVSETRIFYVDIAPPSIELSAPANNGIFADMTVYFNYTATDLIDTNVSCNITVNSAVRDSYYAQSGNLTSRPVVFTEGGDYFWNVTCVDHGRNTNTSETWNFTLSFPPKVNLTSPPPNYFFNDSNVVLYYNASDANNNIANSTIILNGIANMTNQSEILNDEINNFTLVLPNGFYNWTVDVIDTTSLIGNTSTRNFTVDTHPPAIYINAPTQGQVVTWNNITFSFNASDNLDKDINCSLYINDALEVGDIHATNGSTTIVYVVKSDGSYTYNITCMDDAQNKNASQQITFTVLAPPNVTLESPPNGASINSSTISFVYLPADPIGIYNCSLYIDGIFNDSTESINLNQNNTFNVNGINDGWHNWTVGCVDAYPDFNFYAPSPFNFSLDQTKPSIILNSPLNNTNTLRTVDFNFTAFDNMDTNLTCSLYIDNKLNKTNIAALNNTATIVNISKFALGLHRWNVSCFDDANNSNFSANWQFNVTLPDLYVNSSSIFFDNSAPRENDSVLINATIYNIANVSIQSNVIVQFFLGDPSVGGQQIGSNITISSFAPLSSQVVSAYLPSSSLGYNAIFVLVDPPLSANGTIEELNESNNIANNTITVSGWEFVYGNMNSINQFALQDTNSSTVKNWLVLNYQSGNIYVADYDSLIQWLKLQALGRDTSNATAANDFSDLDSLLNMTSFQDSVREVYTNNTDTPTLTDNFTVFRKTVANVPVAESVNNTNFYTGILWDYSKDHNGQYDTTDKEDVVFVTKANKQAQGTYGIYDYEIRIPARLRNYLSPDAIRVNFYTEIN